MKSAHDHPPGITLNLHPNTAANLLSHSLSALVIETLANPRQQNLPETMSRESVVTWADGTTSKVTFSEYGNLSDTGPMDPVLQRIAAETAAQREAELNTPENRQKAAEAKVAERERRRLDFHVMRAIPRCLYEGWKHLRQEATDEEIRVYTTDHKRHRFWGIKPVGMGMQDFWDENDPDVTRYDDNIAMTWANPLFPPPVTEHKDIPVIWAGRGVNPDSTPAEPPVAEAPPPVKAVKSRGRQKSPDVNPTHRVRKSKTPSPKINKKSTGKSLADKTNAGHSRLEDQMPEEQEVAPASKRPSRKKPTITPPDPQPEPATKDEVSAPPKRTRGRPASKANPAPKVDAASLPKRPRGRPAKAKPATKAKDASLPKRPRGRPPGKGKATKVQGNARVTKSSQKERRAVAPSQHKMRTRGKGSAELLQLS